MTIEQVQRLWKAQPFRPFTMYLADGRSIAVEHYEFFARSPSGRTVSVYAKNDSCEIIDLLLVTSVKVGNGQSQAADRGL
jgi:hypothetical protein